jgi:hypothetical protein
MRCQSQGMYLNLRNCRPRLIVYVSKFDQIYKKNLDLDFLDVYCKKSFFCGVFPSKITIINEYNISKNENIQKAIVHFFEYSSSATSIAGFTVKATMMLTVRNAILSKIIEN